MDMHCIRCRKAWRVIDWVSGEAPMDTWQQTKRFASCPRCADKPVIPLAELPRHAYLCAMAAVYGDEADEGASSEEDFQLFEFRRLRCFPRLLELQSSNLLDISAYAREAGFSYPVALSVDAWQHCVETTVGLNENEAEGRLWVVLSALGSAIEASNDEDPSCQLLFTISAPTGPGVTGEIPLKARCGPRDDAEPVIIIKLASEQ